MAKEKRERKVIAFAGAAAVAAVALNLLLTAINSHRNKKKKTTKELPGLVVQVNLSPSEVLKLADNVIAKSKAVHDAVASVPLNKATYMNVIQPLAELEAQQFPLVQSCAFQKMVSPFDDVRKASAEAERRIDAHLLMCSKREDVYRVVKAVAARGEWISPENKHYVQCLVRDFERNGMSLSLSKREEVERLRAEIDDLSMRYIQNLNEDDSVLYLSEFELVGLPQEFIKSLDRADNGKLKITLRSQHTAPILEHCKVGTTRKTVAVAQVQRCGKDNLHILESLIHFRHKLARLLGYSNYADYAVEPRMAKTPAKVFEFLEDVSIHLTEVAARELSMLKDLKKMEEGDSNFGVEDLLYYMRRAEEQKLGLDLGVVKQYFPVSLVLSGIFQICQDLFGLRFVEIEEADGWHRDVCLFSALDSSNELLGYFYLDIYAREGKYGHTCVIALQNGCTYSNGARQMPVALLTSQFQKQADGNPGLLRFAEVVNLFHEFMHVVHHICNCASFARFSGLRGADDFVEIPGQLLENWCYERISLKMLSGFHQDITKPISEEMCELLKRKRDFFSGLRLKQEILLCKLLYNLFMIEIRLILLKLLIDVFSITYTCYVFFSY
eukprot:TRINITY_DN2385_c0_g1_i3.p1 TRINITY_DN2385_c0_g1~~TRINITY_DN2385_c0_g1_i3.p1  ORF type:complete len:612 (-),score=117.61 TRINITY_DN2385_c0_g1_i3:3322-5157(-)